MFRDVSQELGAARNQRNSAVQFRQIRENGENQVSAPRLASRRAGSPSEKRLKGPKGPNFNMEWMKS